MLDSDDTTPTGTATADVPSADPLLAHHRDMLERGSGISAEVIAERGVFSVETEEILLQYGFQDYLWSGPGLMLPIYPPRAREPHLWMYRPDEPHDPKRKSSCRPALAIDSTSRPGAGGTSRTSGSISG